MESFTRNTLRTALMCAALSLVAYSPLASATITDPGVWSNGNTYYQEPGSNTQWAKASVFDNLSYNDAAAVCSTTTGACSGTLNGYDMTGWTWASAQEGAAFLNQFLQMTKPSATLTWTGTTSSLSATGNDAGASYLTSMWDPTYSNYLYQFITRTQFTGNYGTEPVTDSWGYYGSGSISICQGTCVGGTVTLGGTDIGTGLEFYRLTPVPVPPALPLFGSGLVAIGISAIRRKKKARNS